MEPTIDKEIKKLNTAFFRNDSVLVYNASKEIIETVVKHYNRWYQTESFNKLVTLRLEDITNSTYNLEELLERNKGGKLIITDVYNRREPHSESNTMDLYQQMRSQSLRYNTQFYLFIEDQKETELIKKLNNPLHPFYNWLVQRDLNN